MPPLDNTLSVLEEPMQTMRFRGLPYEYGPGQLELAVDVLFQGDGLCRARNGFSPFVPGMPDLTNIGYNYNGGCIGWARTPAGARQVSMMVKRTASVFEFVTAAAAPKFLRTMSPTNHGGSACTIGDFTNVGGIGLFSLASSYDNNGTVPMQLWWGGGDATITPGGSVNITRGSTAITGSPTGWFTQHLGCYVTDSTGTVLVGRLAAMNLSGTAGTLDRPALASIPGFGYRFLSTRNFLPRMAKGRITCGTGSPTVFGALTKFIDGRGAQPGFTCAVPGGITVSGWYLMRASDYAFIGYVQSFDSNLQITLTANAGVPMANERYLLMPEGATSTVTGTSMVWDQDAGLQMNSSFGVRGSGGYITEEHQGRLYMSNRPDATMSKFGATVWFSDDSDYEAFDLSEVDGDWIAVGHVSQPITALVSTQAGLAIFKANELWMLYGDDPVNYQLRKLANIGTMDGRSVQSYGGNLIFVSTAGVMQFDGTTVSNLTANLISPASFAATANFSVQVFPIIGMQVGSVYMWTMSNLFSSSIDALVNGTPRVTNAQLTGCIDLNTGALSVFSNILPNAACQLPQDGQQRSDVAWIGRDGSADAKINVFSAAQIIAPVSAAFGSQFGSQAYTTNNDYWGCALPMVNTAVYTPGPHPYVKTRRITLPQERLGYWKEVWLDYASDDTGIQVESYYGQLGDVTHAVQTAFAAGGTLNTNASIFATIGGRVRLRHRSKYISLVFYPVADPLPLTGGNSSFGMATFTLHYMEMRRTRT